MSWGLHRVVVGWDSAHRCERRHVENLEDKLSAQGPDDSTPSELPDSTDPKRSGRTVDEAVAKAEAGSQIEGVHTPSGQAASGESRVEKMADVEEVAESQAEGNPGEPATPPEPGP